MNPCAWGSSVTLRHLGKVFLSHSSVDKRFVRRLAKRLEEAGYGTWLDEHELVVGDALAAKIAQGIRMARVVLVVVSEASVKSKWLKFELNIAADRMVKGECRVIPIVIDDVGLPPEVLGLTYADFRKSSKLGFKSIVTALQHEARVAAMQAPFYAMVDELVDQVFGGRGYASLDNEYSDSNYETIQVPVPCYEDPESTWIVYVTTPAYGSPARPLSEKWCRDFLRSMDEMPERLYFVVTERPINFDVVRPDSAFPRISYRESDLRVGGREPLPYEYAVFADLAELEPGDWHTQLERTKNLLIELARRLSASN